MVLWARVPLRLSCTTCSAHSVTHAAKLARLSCFHQISTTSKTTKHAENSHEATSILAHSSADLRTLHYRHVELGRSYEREGNKGSLGYRSLSQASQTSDQHSATTSQYNSKIQNDPTASTENGAKSSTTHFISRDASSRLSEELRMAMREVAYPVAVVTSGPVISDEPQEGVSGETSGTRETPLRGLLVSSFNTVTLNPEPYVSFNVKLPSRTWDTITDTREFMVHAMWSTSIAQKFASSQSPVAFPTESAITLDDLDKGRVFGLRCELATYHEVADHMIVVGKVLELMPQSVTPGNTPKHTPLLWKDGKWHTARPLDSDP